MPMLDRRAFVSRSALLAVAALAQADYAEPIHRDPGVKVKLGLNAFSFDSPLRSGAMTLFDLVHFCVENGVDGLDATGYYFPGYPKSPTDETIYRLKRTAFINGITLSGTGVRNDFATADKDARQADIQMVKDWIVVANKLGVPTMRVFSGKQQPAGHSFEEVLEWMVPAFKECAEFGRQYGVVLALQQHNDFLKSSVQTIQLIKAVDSPWFACMLDIGSLHAADPYAEIEALVPYAVSWQIKEFVNPGGTPQPTDLGKIKAIIDKHGYRGFLPFEALGPGDPAPRVVAFLQRIRKAFNL